MQSSNQDVLTELLISQLLDDDIRMLSSESEAEKLQLDQVLALSARSGDRIPKYSNLSPPPDSVVALQLYALDARVNSDAAYAESLQVMDQMATAVSQQYAQKLAAMEKKALLDAEFAKRLQKADDDGMDTDEIRDAESLMGRDAVENILASDLNDKGKSKGTIDLGQNLNETLKSEEDSDDAPAFVHPKCGICLENFQQTHSPVAASLSANSSTRLPFGMRLPCPGNHSYCISCLSRHIHSKLDPDDGTGNSPVFPIRCPECLSTEWPQGIQEDVAQKILGEKGMVLWYHQKLLDSLPRLYCPNPKCSALVQAHEDDEEPQAVCPSCHHSMCVPCRVPWHKNMTCEQYQAVPLDERFPEDLLLLELVKAKRWRRCPNCALIVELVSGCNHMTCVCGTHFCFKCGSPSTTKGKCKRNPPCDLWDEDMLLEENERRREGQEDVRAVAPPPYAPQPPENGGGVEDGEGNVFGWMNDPTILCARHWFTTDMIRNLTCGYCNSRLNTIADLQYHLAHTNQHPVYACCGRFFKRRIDFGRHANTHSARFDGLHPFQTLRNVDY